MPTFSANLGFLWTDRPLPDAIRAAATAGFSAVECHWPYEVPVADVRDALQDTGLPMLGLNTVRGDVAAGDNGLAAVPGREDEARAAIVQAVDYANAIGCGAVHVMAGKAAGEEAFETFVANLAFAAETAGPSGPTILIEPLNAHDAPGYFLGDSAQAATMIGAVGSESVRLMFDCYHVGRTEGDVLGTFRQRLPIIGHIQFAAVPDRGAPDHGEVDYRQVFDLIDELGWKAPLGAEYRPDGDTEASLGWMVRFTE